MNDMQYVFCPQDESFTDYYCARTCSQGVSLVNQHKMVTRALSEEIKDMHGLTVKTSVPK